MAENTVKKGKFCDIEGCRNKVSYSRKVRLIEQVDGYETAMKLCSRHKNYFKEDQGLVSIDLKGYGKETLLGVGPDKDRQGIVNDTLDYMRKQAKAAGRGKSVQIMINAAKHFAKVGDGKFLFGFYFGGLFAISSFRSFGTDVTRQRRAQEIRKQMSLRQPYAAREHPETGNEIIDVCRCGHEKIMHDYGEPRGACFTCLCPRYEFEQRLTRAEASDLQSLIYRELRENQARPK